MIQDKCSGSFCSNTVSFDIILGKPHLAYQAPQSCLNLEPDQFPVIAVLLFFY